MTARSALCAIVLATVATASVAQPPGRGPGHGPGGGRGGMGRGRDASLAHDQSVFHELLANHAQIERSVTQLPDGVRTRTTSQDPKLTGLIQDHVAAMAERVKEGRPVRRWDPLFAELFANGANVEIQVKEIDGGVEVIETSEEPQVVKLIQAHASVVSGFVAEGFAEARRAHEAPKSAANMPPDVSDDAAAMLTATSAKLDRLYIPALALTNQGKAEPSRKAIQRLKTQLPQLAVSVDSNEAGTTGLFDGLAEIVQEAERLTATGELQEAHESLEPIREQLAERRRELGVSYPLDVLSDYHAVMEAIVKPATKAASDRVDDSLRTTIAELAAEASRVWAVAEQTDFSVVEAPTGWPTRETTQKNVAAVRASITRLNEALRDGDSQATLEAARALKPVFARLYMSFGDFDLSKPAR